MGIETITGDLKDAYKQAVPGTVLHVDELHKERQTNKELQNTWFYTADGEIYFMNDKKPMWAITRELTNPVLKNIDDAFKQLTKERDYKVKQDDFDAAIQSADTVRVDLTKLRLQKHDEEWSYLAINTSKRLSDYNREEQKVLKRIFGPSAKDYSANMKTLRESPQKIKETKIFVLNPEYVKEQAKDNVVGRASWLNSFDNISSFGAGGRGLDYSDRVRGVRRGAEGAREKTVPDMPFEVAQQISFDIAYARIVGFPKELTDNTAAGLLGVVANFYAQRQK